MKIMYKGFDKDFKCRGFQYAVGKTYIHEGIIKACVEGFHACEHPLGVLSYYPPIDGNRYAVVHLEGDVIQRDDKTVSSVITIVEAVDIAGLISNIALPPVRSATSGDSSHSVTSGDRSHSATSGHGSHSVTSGYGSHSVTSGEYAHSATSGYDSRAATSGKYSNACSLGLHADAEARGKQSIAAALGAGKARAGEGGAIVLVERDDEGCIIAVFSSKVGENGIKPNVWYTLKKGNPVEVTA